MNFMNSVNYEKKEVALGLAILYAVASVFSVVLPGLTAMEQPAAENARNMGAFNALALDDPRRSYNDPARAVRWESRQKEIGRQITNNRQPYWDWIPFTGYRFDLRDSLNRANIAVLPDAETRRPVSLIVGSAHGCLMVDWAKTDRQNADEARIVLEGFNARSKNATDFYGVYTARPNGTVEFMPLKESHPALSMAGLPCSPQ